MSVSIFIDSNIFLYALDNGEPVRQKQAQAALLRAEAQHRVVISTQVLNEIFAVATRKMHADPIVIKEFIRGLYSFEVVQITKEIIESAIDCSILQRINYWDALMVAVAESTRCAELWTEDLNSGEVVRGVKIANPLLD